MLGPRPQRFSKNRAAVSRWRCSVPALDRLLGPQGWKNRTITSFLPTLCCWEPNMAEGQRLKKTFMLLKTAVSVDAAMPPCCCCFGSTSNTSEHRRAFFRPNPSSLPAPLIPSKKDLESHSSTPTCFFPNSSELRVNFTEGFYWFGGAGLNGVSL